MKNVGNYMKGEKVKDGFVGDFDLEDSLKYPKPCAEYSSKPHVDVAIPSYFVGRPEREVKASTLDFNDTKNI